MAGVVDSWEQQWEGSRAAAALVLSVVGVVTCLVPLCPIGLYLGAREIKGIDAGRRNPSGRGVAQAAMVIGTLGTLLLGFMLLLGLYVIGASDPG